MSGGGFFIGWEGRADPPLRRFLARLVAGLLAGLAALALLLAQGGADHAGPGFGGAAPALAEGPQRLEGVLTAQPYPMMHLAAGQAVLLAGEGKTGSPGDADSLAGQRVTAEGYLTHRGRIAMLALAEPPVALGPGTAPAAQPLGRWRLTGEICDGKCAAGVMRPGTGIAHRACANFCVAGGVPAIFVTTAPLAGQSFLVLADAAGRPSPGAWRGLMGLRVALEGEVLRLGQVLVFRAEAQP